MDEGQSFMKAAQNVMRHYSVQTTQKTMDWISFAGVTAMIYVPRVVAISNRRKPAEVVQLRPVAAQPFGTATPGAVPPGSPFEMAAAANNVMMPEHET